MALTFNDTSTENGFCQEIDQICSTNVAQQPLKVKARRLNNALDNYFSKTMVWCGNWSVGDSNATDLNIATANIVSGQQDIALSTSMLVIESVWIASVTGGQFTRLEFNDTEDWTSNSTITGIPSSYRKREYSILFNVTPNFNSTAGIKIYYRRALPRFVSTDTTKTAGTPGIHDFYLARVASLPYLIEKGMPNKNDIAAQIKEDEIMISDFYNNRGRDEGTKGFKFISRSSR